MASQGWTSGVLVARQPGFDGGSRRLTAELREEGILHPDETITVLRHYRVDRREPPEAAVWERALTLVFVDAAEDRVVATPAEAVEARAAELSAAEVPPAGDTTIFDIAVRYHREQYDQRADAAHQALGLLGIVDAAVTVAEVYVVRLRHASPEVAAARRRDLETRLVNPVDSETVDLTAPAADRPIGIEFSSTDSAGSPTVAGPVPAGASSGGIDSTGATAAGPVPAGDLTATGLNAADRAFVAAYFEREGREPTETELAVIDTYWSDHCRHTTFRTELTTCRITRRGVPDGEAVAVQTAIQETLDWYLAERRRRGEEERPITLMDLATAMMRWRRQDGVIPEVVFSAEINACTVRVSAETPGLETAMEGQSPWLVLFKNETHNHPTEIEPYGGAATCLGGAIRDPLSGRSFVYQAMRVSGAADPRRGRTAARAGKLPQRLITTGAAHGYSSYGNQIGVATGLVDEVYHPGYRAKRLEMGAVVGAIPESHVRREEPAPGDVVYLIGGRTGRDGIGGATGSSRSHDRGSLDRAGAEVQKGNPPVERALQRLFRRREFARLVKRSNDFGAGGVAVAVGEIAEGVVIDLDRVPRKYEGLTATEVAISESQERMAVVVDPADGVAVERLAREENLDATAIARVTEERRLVMRAGGAPVVDLDREFVDSAGVRGAIAVELPVVRPGAPQSEDAGHSPGGGGGTGDSTERGAADAAGGSVLTGLETVLADLRFAARLDLTEWFDSTIGAGTVLGGAAGRLQRSPVAAMAARLPAAANPAGSAPEVATVLAYGFDPDESDRSPWRGGYRAVLESVARLVAAGVAPGAAWLSLQEYFPRPGDAPERWGLPAAAILGALAAQRDLGVTAIGGKDSMSGSFEELDVPPTLISVALGVTPTDRVVPSHCASPDLPLYLVWVPETSAGVPTAAGQRELFQRVHRAIESRRVRAAAPVRGAGWLATAVQMCFGENLGIDLDRRSIGRAPDPFVAGYGAIVLQLDDAPDGATGSPAGPSILPGADRSVRVRRIGVTNGSGVIRVGDEQRRTADLYRAWSAPLAPVFGDGAVGTGGEQRQSDGAVGTGGEQRQSDGAGETAGDFGAGAIPAAAPRSAGARSAALPEGRAVPTVVIPVFPGTNCEDDSRRVWEDAGARVEEVVLATDSAARLGESLTRLAERLANAQILMLAGGFSAGDEPGGSGKYIAAVLQEPRVREVLERDYVSGDRLILGICNGFQALVRTGLVPFGEFRPRRAGAPTLAPNAIGHHVSRTVLTRVETGGAPWFPGLSSGEIVSVPVSHGEGRLTGAPAVLDDLERAGQVAARYVDWQGRVRQDHPWNPNGSDRGIEALVSPDGRFLGKMGHTERVRPGLARQVPMVGTMDLWSAGVAWFG